MSERELPNDVKAEAGLVSIFLHQKENKALTESLDRGLTPEMFYDKKLGLITRACWELYADLKPINKENIVAWLKEQGRLEEAGGEATVAGLETRTDSEGWASYCIEIIKEKAFRRKLVETTVKAVEKNLDEKPSDIALAWMKEAIEKQFLPVGKAVVPDDPAERKACKKLVENRVMELFVEARKKRYSLLGTLWILTRLVKKLNNEKG